MIKSKCHTNWFFLLNAAIIISGVLSSCEKKPDDLGLGILPGDDNLLVHSDTIYNILANTVKLDSVFTFAPDTNFNYASNSLLKPKKILGEYHDNFWGRTKSSLLLNFYPDSLNYNLNDKTIDSLVFYLEYDSILGNKNANLELTISELKTGLNYRKEYYSNLNEDEYKGSIIASQMIRFADTLLKVKIDVANNADFISRVRAVPEEAQKDLLKFHEFFKGFHLDVKSVDNPGALAIIRPLSYTSYSGLMFYYHTATDTASFFFSVKKGSVRANKFSHDYTGTAIETALQNAEPGQKTTYIQGMSGTGTRIRIPDINSWVEKRPVSINNAELIIPVDTSNISAIPYATYPARLSILAISPESKFSSIEYGTGQTFLGGIYDKEKKAYVFNLARHIQKMANNKHSGLPAENPDLIVMADAYKIEQPNTFGKVALDFSPGKAKLNIIYSKQ